MVSSNLGLTLRPWLTARSDPAWKPGAGCAEINKGPFYPDIITLQEDRYRDGYL